MRETMSNRRKWTLLVVSGLVLTGAVAWAVFDHYEDRSIAAYILNIDALPATARGVECKGWGLTDFVATCAFELAPSDHRRLLIGRAFVPTPCRSRTAYDFNQYVEVGPDFQAATCLEVNSQDFAYGGELRFATDEERRYVLIDAYFE